MTFEQFMFEVNKLLEQALGLTYEDIVDYGYSDRFEDGMSPREVVEEIKESYLSE